MALTIISVVLGVVTAALLLALLLRGRGQESIGSELTRLGEQLRLLDATLAKTEQAVREESRQNRQEINSSLLELTKMNEQKLEIIRASVDNNLKSIQEDNSRKLEQMRETVDVKLQSTLEKRLGESFTQVSERLESVYKGLGEMQKLASEVGNLKGVLSNIKTRGTFGEIQLEKILEQILLPGQYEKDSRIEGNNRVEFAIKLPEALLPVDSKLPLTEYERLCDAQELGDKELVKSCADSLEAAVKLQAKDINSKYLAPPKTTDFGIMFLPIEGLYAEVLRRPGLSDSLFHQYRIVVAGPTTFAAILNGLRMGFKSLAIEEHASEVAKLLGAVKTDFGKFSELLEGVRKNLDAASNKIDEAARRTGIIGRKLKEVEALPAADRDRMLEDSEETGEGQESEI